MNNPEKQMAAMSATMRMLMSGHKITKPRNLLIAATNQVSESILDLMMAHALGRRSTFLAIFYVEEDTALLERVMVFDGSTKKGEVNIGGGSFAQKANGSFAILSTNREEPYEYFFSRRGRRLERQAVADDSSRAVMEMRGLQALLAKAVTPACRDEARTASMTEY